MDTIHGFLIDVQRILVQLHREANERPAPFVDHTGVLRDSKTGRPINAITDTEDDDLMGTLFYILNLSSAVEHLVLQSAIPSSTALRLSWPVGGSVTRTTTLEKLYHWPNTDRSEWGFVVMMSLYGSSALYLRVVVLLILVYAKVPWTFQTK